MEDDECFGLPVFHTAKVIKDLELETMAAHVFVIPGFTGNLSNSWLQNRLPTAGNAPELGRSGGRRRGGGSMRVSAGSHDVGKALDGELAQLVWQAGLTSAQTDAVTPPPTGAIFPRQNNAHA